MNDRIKAAKDLLRRIRTTERKICWVEGYISNHMPDAQLIKSLEENGESLRRLEKDLIQIIVNEEENDRLSISQQESSKPTSFHGS